LRITHQEQRPITVDAEPWRETPPSHGDDLQISKRVRAFSCTRSAGCEQRSHLFVVADVATVDEDLQGLLDLPVPVDMTIVNTHIQNMCKSIT